MPRKVEEALKRAARAHGYKPGTPGFQRYVYGTLARIKKNKESKPHGSNPSGH